MSIAMIFAVAGLVAAGTFLVTSRSLSRIVLGFALLGHAAVLALLAAGGRAGSPPIVDGEPLRDMSNPLPQALSLTAIVISFGLTLFVLALARRQQMLTGDDLVEDDVEDRRIATTHDDPAESVDETRQLETLHDNAEDGS
jgi:multicomponent Na+:H+ antiporter subunit C